MHESANIKIYFATILVYYATSSLPEAKYPVSPGGLEEVLALKTRANS